MSRLYPVCTRGETVTPRDATNNQRAQGPAKTVGKIGSLKMPANGGDNNSESTRQMPAHTAISAIVN
jgi:hypothetical protein